MIYKIRQFATFFSAFAIIFLTFSNCTQSVQNTETKRNICIEKVDSLANMLQSTRNLFVFKMDEFIERQEEMNDNLTKVKFIPANKLTEENMSDVSQYNAIFNVYKSNSGKYKEVVLEAENLFYEIKGIEQELKKGKFDKEIDEFLNEYNHLKIELKHNHEETIEVTEKLKSVEPTYMRIAPAVDQIMESNFPTKQ
jgi:hypothetical protein